MSGALKSLKEIIHARLCVHDCNFFFLLEFAYQTQDAATGTASIIVNNEGTCFAY